MRRISQVTLDAVSTERNSHTDSCFCEVPRLARNDPALGFAASTV
jgi:hypothetical protein